MLSDINVSREIQDRLEKYQALLVKWQARINLVAPDTLADSWNRHFVDSLQLLPFLPTQKFTLIDMGTGAGFPGLVIAIARPNSQIHLIESDAKKCEFLKTVSRETETLIGTPTKAGAPSLPDPGRSLSSDRAERGSGGRDDNDSYLAIHNSRIEAVPPFFTDIITARALASLTELLGYALPYANINSDLRMIYLKGARWESEINDARHIYMFDVETHESLTSNQSRVLIISNLKRK